MNLKAKKQLAYRLLEGMEKLFPEAKSELVNWETDFQFLICVILSAQTTDAMVNRVVVELFKHYPDAKSLAKAEIDDVEKLIKNVNYYRNKSKYIVQASRMIVSEFGGVVPKSIEKLILLPGVGRKVAHVYINDLHQANQGIGVDTHILRVSKRMGLTKNSTPEKVAADLEKIYDKKDWYKVNSLFVLYGRYYCKARVKPEISECIFKDVCSWCGTI